MKLDLTKLDSQVRELTLEQTLLRFTSLINEAETDPALKAIFSGYQTSSNSLALNLIGLLHAFHTQKRVVACVTREYLATLAKENPNATYGLNNNEYAPLLALARKLGLIKIISQKRRKPAIIELLEPALRSAILAKGANRQLQLAECRKFIKTDQPKEKQKNEKQSLASERDVKHRITPMVTPAEQALNSEISENRAAIVAYKVEIARDVIKACVAQRNPPAAIQDAYPSQEPLYDPELRLLFGFNV